ncbi:MAG: penicillin-binding transpeptidase domain-containing protein, partial [Armatimonadota bacterium]|nr:penicillin-binding transpeptidase domain-containing protein [Armatimonadota bacterium]
ATPLQVAQMMCVIASGGVRYRPRVIRSITSPQGAVVKEFPVEEAARVPLRPEVLSTIRAGLRQAVTHGTGRTADLKEIAVAGKTGSAEHHRRKKPHAWFCCYAPAQNPTIVIAVLVEEGGHGSTAAGPIARRMLEAYFGIESNAPLPLVAGD